MMGDEESYAPVSSWSSICVFLVLSMMLNWVTISVDWNNAFIQAKLKEPMYMSSLLEDFIINTGRTDVYVYASHCMDHVMHRVTGIYIYVKD